MVLGCILEKLPKHQQIAVERWIIHVEMRYPVEEKKWMNRDGGYRRQRQNPSMVYLLTPQQIVKFYIKTNQRRRPTRKNIKYFEKCLENGLRTMALEYEKFLFEGVA